MKEGIILKAQHGCWDLPKRLKKFLKSIKKDFVVRTYGETNFLDSRNVYLEPRNKEAIEKNLPKIKKILKELENDFPYELQVGEVEIEEVGIYSTWNSAYWGSRIIYKAKK